MAYPVEVAVGMGMLRWTMGLALWALTLGWGGPAAGAEYYVGAGLDFPTILDALEAVEADDTLYLAPGDHELPASLSVSLRLIGAGVGVTRLISTSGSVVHLDRVELLMLSDLSIDGEGQRRCARIVDSAMLASQVHTEGCEATGDGGTFWVEDGGLFLHQVWMSSAGALNGGQVAAEQSTIFLSRVIMEPSQALGKGGAIHGVSSTVTLRDAYLLGGSAVAGGGLHLTGGSLLLEGGELRDYEAIGGLGGGISLEEADAELRGVTLRGNTAAVRGGQIASTASRLWIEESTFKEGAAAIQGGGIFATEGGPVHIDRSHFLSNQVGMDGGGLAIQGIDDFQVRRSLFCENQATDGEARGGAVWLRTSGSVEGLLENNVFVHNAAGGYGGAVAQVSGEVRASFNHVVRNLQGADSAMLHLNGQSEVRDSLISGSNSRGLRVVDEEQPVEYNLFYLNAGGHANHPISNSNVVGADPLLLQYRSQGGCADQDLRPRLGSPLIDAADPAHTDPDGTRADIGAYGGPQAAPELYEDGDGDGVIAVYDCDDADESIYPGATEIPADGIDQDCDGADLCYEDLDRDGFGSEVLVPGSPGCDAPGVSAVQGDCDDLDPEIYPGAPEIVGDGVDQDCDGADACYLDEDGDGYGGLQIIAGQDLDCSGPNESALGGDCDDLDPQVYPGKGCDPLEPEEVDPVEADRIPGGWFCATSGGVPGAAWPLWWVPLLWARRRAGVRG